jgi:hypothetical protein
MKVDLIALPGDVEAYRVKLIEDDGNDADCDMGHVTRTSASTWDFVVDTDGGVNIGGQEVPAVTEIHAHTADELKTHFGGTMQRLDIKADRIRAETMCHMAEAMMHNLLRFAAHTDSIPGYMEALACNIALLIEKHVQDDKREQMMAKIAEAVAHERAQYTKKKELAKQIKELDLGSILSKLFGGENDEKEESQEDKPTAH